MNGPLTAFVKARLDEDEATANALTHDVEDSEKYSCPGSRTGPIAGTDLEWGEDHCWCGLAERKGRALREVAAMRAIVVEHRQAELPKYGRDVPRCAVCLSGRDRWQEDWSADPWPCTTLRQLAAVWSDHADYRQEWRP